MTKTTIKETADILKRLSPQNQAYFMTLVRVAETAENSVKNAFGCSLDYLVGHEVSSAVALDKEQECKNIANRPA